MVRTQVRSTLKGPIHNGLVSCHATNSPRAFGVTVPSVWVPIFLPSRSTALGLIKTTAGVKSRGPKTPFAELVSKAAKLQDPLTSQFAANNIFK